MIKRFLRKIFGIKEPKKPASATAKSRLETLIRAENRASTPRQATSSSGRRRDTGDDANDLLNPLNVLSPLSPVSPLNPLNQLDDPGIRQRVEDSAVSRTGNHSHWYSSSPKSHDDGSHRHSYNDVSDRHSHSFGGSHSHSNHDSTSYDSGSGDSGGSSGVSD